MASSSHGRISSATWHRCVSLLNHCSNLRHLRSIHAFFLTHGLLLDNTFALSRLILAACSLDALPYASLLFHRSSPPPNPFIFNTLIRFHSSSPSLPHLSLSFFLLMLRSPFPPDHHTFPFALSASSSLPSLGHQLHSLLSKNALAASDHFVQTALLRFYLRTDDLSSARKLFDEIPHRDPVHLDVLMNGYLRRRSPSDAIRLFRHMLRSGMSPDAHTITTALTACSHAGALDQGVWIHKLLLSPHHHRDTYVASALISMYAKCGHIGEAVDVFETTAAKRNTFMWSAMISGFAMHGLAKDAIGCLDRMEEGEGIRPDGVVILGVLTACAHSGLVEEGLLLLADMELRYGVLPQHEHYSCAVDMLCRVGRLDDAMRLIGKMPMRPMASVWGSLLTGCRAFGNVELAERAVGELQKIASSWAEEEVGDDEGVYVQLSNIYMNANMREDARRVRKMIGSRGMKKTPACSWIEVEGEVSSFVAGDEAHPLRIEIGRIMEVLTEDMSGWSGKTGRRDLAFQGEIIDVMSLEEE